MPTHDDQALDPAGAHNARGHRTPTIWLRWSPRPTGWSRGSTGVRRVRPDTRVRDRPGPGRDTDGQAEGGADGAVRAWRRSGLVRRSSISPTRSAASRRGARERAGMRVHGTTSAVRSSMFRLEERPHAAAGTDRSSMTCRSTRRARSIGIITSRSPRRSTRCPGNLIGSKVEVRADRESVRIFASWRSS